MIVHAVPPQSPWYEPANALLVDIENIPQIVLATMQALFMI